MQTIKDRQHQGLQETLVTKRCAEGGFGRRCRTRTDDFTACRPSRSLRCTPGFSTDKRLARQGCAQRIAEPPKALDARARPLKLPRRRRVVGSWTARAGKGSAQGVAGRGGQDAPSRGTPAVLRSPATRGPSCGWAAALVCCAGESQGVGVAWGACLEQRLGVGLLVFCGRLGERGPAGWYVWALTSKHLLDCD